MIYIEGVMFSLALFVLPLINVVFFKYFLLPYLCFILGLGIYSAILRRRLDLLLFSPTYLVLVFVNAGIFLEQFVKEILLRKNSMVWFKPERAKILYN